eukprot:6179293-Pleurochrysis_carterae.AAC.5
MSKKISQGDARALCGRRQQDTAAGWLAAHDLADYKDPIAAQHSLIGARLLLLLFLLFPCLAAAHIVLLLPCCVLGNVR